MRFIFCVSRDSFVYDVVLVFLGISTEVYVDLFRTRFLLALRSRFNGCLVCWVLVGEMY